MENWPKLNKIHRTELHFKFHLIGRGCSPSGPPSASFHVWLYLCIVVCWFCVRRNWPAAELIYFWRGKLPLLLMLFSLCTKQDGLVSLSLSLSLPLVSCVCFLCFFFVLLHSTLVVIIISNVINITALSTIYQPTKYSTWKLVGKQNS